LVGSLTLGIGRLVQRLAMLQSGVCDFVGDVALYIFGWQLFGESYHPKVFRYAFKVAYNLGRAQFARAGLDRADHRVLHRLCDKALKPYSEGMRFSKEEKFK